MYLQICDLFIYLNHQNRFTLLLKAVLNMLPDHKLLSIEDTQTYVVKVKLFY